MYYTEIIQLRIKAAVTFKSDMQSTANATM